ncbi:MAG: ATP-binding protein, partial [Chloroflexi bacterium]|nr:ATP-binding protein [Chloroflexota bacterium]
MTRIEPPPIPAHAHMLATTACLDQLPAVMDLAQQVLETLVPSTTTRYECLTVVDESITNVILHAYGD